MESKLLGFWVKNDLIYLTIFEKSRKLMTGFRLTHFICNYPNQRREQVCNHDWQKKDLKGFQNLQGL